MNQLKLILRSWILDEKHANKVSYNGLIVPFEKTKHGTINVSLTFAEGGTVVSTNIYQDESPNITNMYVLTSDANLGESLNRIITVEKMRA